MTESEWLASEDPQVMLEWLYGGCGSAVGVSDRKLRLFACACCRKVWHLLTDKRSRRAVEVAEWYADGKANEAEAQAAYDAAIAAWQGTPSGDARGVASVCCDLLHPELSNQDMLHVLMLGSSVNQAHLLRDIIGNPHNPVRIVRKVKVASGTRPAPEISSTAETSWEKWEDRTPTWLTPTVLSLAQTAYEERSVRECKKCHAHGQWKRCNGCGGEWAGDVGPDCFVCGHPYLTQKTCPECHGSGRIEDGTLDSTRLLVLSDALEEAGCDNEDMLHHLRGEERYHEYSRCQRKPGAPQLCETCLRNRAAGWQPLPSPHVRGCWVIDLLTGKS